MRWKALLQTGTLLMLISVSAPAQPSLPFKKGVNLTNWFQASSATEIQFTKFTRKDLERIKSLGCDVIRLPIKLHAMTSGEPDYVPHPIFLNFLDQVVTWAEELQIHLILDNHTFDASTDTSPTIGPVLVKVWSHMAEHYKDRSTYIYYEILNEPHGISDTQWAGIQQTVIDAIRAKDTRHTIIVGPANWNSYHNLSALPVYTDNNLIYTFHFYDPFIFTHQGASWTNPSLVPLGGVPFPYNAATMPATPAVLKGTWIENSIKNYSTDGTVSKVKSLIDIAVNFSITRQVPVFCGELGVYMPNSNNEQRVFWYESVRKYLEEKNISWTMWDYTGGFGLFKNGSNELFDHDLNVSLLQALGMNVPTQTPFIKKPARKGFMMYDDFIGERIVDRSFTPNGIRDFYNTTTPHAGDYCIYWSGSDQYSNIGFDFKPDLDLTLLREYNYIIKFWARTNSSSTKIDIRFVDSKTGVNDHPWRMGKTIEQILPGNEIWTLIEIPLKELIEKGSWDNAWYTAEGKFDWTSIDRFEIVAEHHNLQGIKFWFDDMEISGEEQIPEETITGIEHRFSPLPLNIAPNPVTDNASIYFSLDKASSVKVVIYSLTGQEIDSMETGILSAGDHQISWNADKCLHGVYVVKIKSGSGVGVGRLVR